MLKCLDGDNDEEKPNGSLEFRLELNILAFNAYCVLFRTDVLPLWEKWP